ncbi:hypothetical protein [Nonomuraea sp. GTA35]|uniref:hypothetical protein n=1 Tax=Nonomuraea sp. GTA35 TaxID=1676746 RepID=UPI0035C13DD7
MLAVKLVRWSARLRYLDAARGEVRAEELAAYVRDMPGNLFKLFIALWFMAGASVAWAHRGRRWFRRWQESRAVKASERTQRPATLVRRMSQGGLRLGARVSPRSALKAAVMVGAGGVLLQLVIDLFQVPSSLVNLIKVFNGVLIGTGALVALAYAGGGRRVGSWVRQYRARSGRRR